MSASHRPSSTARGFTLIEVLVALVVLAFGMLSLVRVIARSTQEEMEAYQRSQALTLAADMVDRIRNNPKQASSYEGDDPVYTPAAGSKPEDCTGLLADVVKHDQCEWRNRLRGADVQDGAKYIGAPIAIRGCVSRPDAAIDPNNYVVAVAWQGILPTKEPQSPCGTGKFDDEKKRRVATTVVQIVPLNN